MECDVNGRPRSIGRNGTLVERDGDVGVSHQGLRIQRVRRAVRHIGQTRDESGVLDELASRIALAVPA